MELKKTIITKNIKLNHDETNNLKSLFTRDSAVNQNVIDYFRRINKDSQIPITDNHLPRTITCVTNDHDITISEEANYMNTVWEIKFLLTNEPETIIHTNV